MNGTYAAAVAAADVAAADLVCVYIGDGAPKGGARVAGGVGAGAYVWAVRVRDGGHGGAWWWPGLRRGRCCRRGGGGGGAAKVF